MVATENRGRNHDILIGTKICFFCEIMKDVNKRGCISVSKLDHFRLLQSFPCCVRVVTDPTDLTETGPHANKHLSLTHFLPKLTTQVACATRKESALAST